MIVLSEASSAVAGSPGEQDNRDMTEAARLIGFHVYHLPKDFSQCENAENALWHIPQQPTATDAIWVGFIPTPERYEAIYLEAARKNIQLLNNPSQHLIAQEFDRAYPLLNGLTPESMVLTHANQSLQAGEQLGFPLFVRGSVRSRKAAGWKACVAQDQGELAGLVEQFLQLQYRSRGRVIVRKLVSLQHTRHSDEGFPLGREYRVIVLDGKTVGHGYYWEGEDPLKRLSQSEEAAVSDLAIKAASRSGVPFLAVDIGQRVDGEWIVIEVNDAQFAGMGQIPLLPLWGAIRGVLESRSSEASG